MAVTGFWFPAGLVKILTDTSIDLDGDTWKAMLTTSTYTPNRSTHNYKDDVTNEVTGTGYTAGGTTMTSVTVTHVLADSWATSRANSTAYVAGQVVRPATGNTFLYQAITGGTSGGSIPTYPTTYGGTVTDGSVVWECVAASAIVLDAADLSWTTATITARYGVIYDSTPGTDATRPLIAYFDFGTDQTSTAGTFSVTFDATGICYLLMP